MKNRPIDKFYYNKLILDRVYIHTLSTYNIHKLLYASLWRMEELSVLQKILRIIACLVLNQYRVKLNKVNGVKHLSVRISYGGNIRKDNELIFNNVEKYLEPCNKAYICKTRTIQPHKFLKKTQTVLKYAAKFDGFNLWERLYLASQLVIALEVTEYMGQLGAFDDISHLLIFQEEDYISNAIIQTAQINGIKVISPQHGLPMNRKIDFDQLHFECFCCDYKLLWNEFSKRQFTSFGISDEKLFVLGNPKKIGTTQDSVVCNTKTFGVLLDWPFYENAVEINRKLISIATSFAKNNGLTFILKLHPADDFSNYVDIIEKEVCTLSQLYIQMGEYENLVAFSLAHITGAIMDLLYDRKIVFLFDDITKYPIELDEFFFFNDDVDLEKKYEKIQFGFDDLVNSTLKPVWKECCVENESALYENFFNEYINK